MNVLVAEDERITRNMLTTVLARWGYTPIPVDDGIQAMDILTGAESPQLALIDWNMPGMSGLEVCRYVMERESSNPPYIILLTAHSDTTDIVLGLESGASDYICKPYHNDELRARLRVGERMLKLQADLNETREILVYQARHDALTGILNRRAIMEILNQEIVRARRLQHILSIGICDLDHFKQVNDTYGHQVGDEVLKMFTQIVQGTLRDTDYLGRWGGEEFLIVAPSVGTDSNSALFERIRKNVEKASIAVGEGTLQITVSIGVSEQTGELSADEVVRVADNAMYIAKNEGRNWVAFSEVE